MDIDRTIAELELKRLIESLSSTDFVEKWTDEHRKEFIRLVKRLGVEDLEFNVVNSITEKEMEHHYRVFFNWGLMTEMKKSKKISLTCSGNELGVYSRKGMYFLNDSNPSMIWRPEIHDEVEYDEDDENKFYWSYWMFFNELKYAINETYNPVTGPHGIYRSFPKKSVHQVLQTPFMVLVKRALRIED